MTSRSILKYPRSHIILDVSLEDLRIHKGDGDMWPITWAADDNLYGGAGDNMDSPMNFWRIVGGPEPHHSWSLYLELIDRMPIDPRIYCNRELVHSTRGVKPASLISIDGIIYFAVELHNYGENPEFNRQRNVSSWIITTKDYGLTWDREATPLDFFTGRLASPHFIQFGRDYEGARDEYVYACFSAGEDGKSYWCNGDYILLGRVEKEKILAREEWLFYAGQDILGVPIWQENEENAVPIFEYYHMTGENHVSYNRGLQRYIMGNFSFLSKEGWPRPYHQKWPESVYPSQLTLFEAPEPWGPWSLFYQDDHWGRYGDYQPSFPTKWMSEDGTRMWMVSSGSYEDYNFTVQRIDLQI